MLKAPPRKDLRTVSDPLKGRLTLRPQNRMQEVLHERNWTARARIIAALDDSYARDHQRWARRMAECASVARFYVDPAIGRVRPWINRCRHKLCPFCGNARTNHVADQLTTLMERMTRPRTIILTVRSNDRPLREQVASLRRWFRKLRTRRFWRDRANGGAYTLEITLNERTQLWHPHLHVVYDGQYIPFKLLQNQWHDVTGGSEVVWLQEIRDPKAAARELAKYIGKVQRLDRLDDSHLRQYADGVNRTRMVQTFGNSHGRRVEDRDPEPADSPDAYTLTLPRVVYLANLGDSPSQRLLALIVLRWPVFAAYILHEAPQAEPGESIHRRRLRAAAKIAGFKPPARGPPTVPTEPHKLDALIFLAFTRLRLDEQGGVHERLEPYRPPEQWQSG